MSYTDGAAKDKMSLIIKAVPSLRVFDVRGSNELALSVSAPKPEGWLFPVENGIITSGFGDRTSPISGSAEIHNGVDIAVPEGTEVRAVSDGIITSAGLSESYGLFIREQTDDGYTALYAHLSAHKISEGNRVERGSLIALSGHTGWTTGPHLHLTAEKNGHAFDPMTMYKELG